MELDDILSKRDVYKKVVEEFESVSRIEYIQQLIDALPYLGAVLNSHWQVVFANRTLLEKMGHSFIEQLLGNRPGEFLHCVNSKNDPRGCGSSAACQSCGALGAIIKSKNENKQITSECRINASWEGKLQSFDFRVTASPFLYKGETFIVFSLVDISDEKRRKVLERIFFHDIINKTDCLKGLVELFKEETDPEKMTQFIDTIDMLSHSIVDEIFAQRELLNAENGELKPHKTLVKASDLLDDAIHFMRHHEMSLDKSICVKKTTDQSIILTDKVLLQRTLINMLKNALEAEPEGCTIHAGIDHKGNLMRFWVKNPSHMKPEVKSQIFQRSFSTKSSNRGIGTYSIKLLGEKYLGGTVGFSSEPNEGTFFFIDLPTGQ